MFHRISQAASKGHSQRLWPVFAVLMLMVALPTAGVLWFMNLAMQNERLAVRQRLTELYSSQLQSAASLVQTSWREKLSLINQAHANKKSSSAFGSLTKAGIVDSVLFFEKGRLIYPDLSSVPGISAEPETPLYLEAHRLEFEGNDPKAAAKIYGEIAEKSSRVDRRAMALLAQSRCLNKAGEPQHAIKILTDTLAEDHYRNAVDNQGRRILPNALFFSLQLMKSPSHPDFAKTAETLAERLNDYEEPPMPSSQRRFLMQQLRSLWPGCPPFPTYAAEEMALPFEKSASKVASPGKLQPSGIDGVWAYRTPDQSVLALFREERVGAFINEAVAGQERAPGIQVRVLSPDDKTSGFLTAELGEAFPSWRLGLDLEGQDPFAAASNQRITVHIWTGILTTVGIVLLSILMAGYLRRQIRLTRLKNDLIATVSHELKTPLASMRLLVDTLRDGHSHDAQLVDEYLQLISKENSRLSSLIEGFLTFSRMERNKAQFDRSLLQTEEIVHAAVDAVGDRLQAPGCRLELDLDSGLPGVIGDRDALITVLVNLLDNALKYSGDDKKIHLRGSTIHGHVRIEVQDNGIGFPRSAAKKIFDRFYQVDRSLSRRAGGCGLGLSIVKFIVAAHSGSVTAKSQPGKGSTFTVQLPAA